MLGVVLRPEQCPQMLACVRRLVTATYASSARLLRVRKATA